MFLIFFWKANWDLYTCFSGVQCRVVMVRVMWQGSTLLIAAHQAAPLRQRGKRTATSMARSLSGNLARQMAWPARPRAVMAQGTSVGASWPTGGKIFLTLNKVCHQFQRFYTILGVNNGQYSGPLLLLYMLLAFGHRFSNKAAICMTLSMQK